MMGREQSDSPLSERPAVLLFRGRRSPAAEDQPGSLPGRCDCCGVCSCAEVLPSWPLKQLPVIALRILFIRLFFLRWESTIQRRGRCSRIGAKQLWVRQEAAVLDRAEVRGLWLRELAVQHGSLLVRELVGVLVAEDVASDQIRDVDVLDLMVAAYERRSIPKYLKRGNIHMRWYPGLVLIDWIGMSLALWISSSSPEYNICSSPLVTFEV
ncbi:hypothetical protein F2Q69_00058876 [Brassica cretica]|uniref:Uncharacterized protein n=1 Tax=Brassica cretica TaxID=69181 RepID=A0A8S9RHL6_BRACR|nr:hypothetical protein F2Q69_00058876 [Brassica cretica]